MNARLFSQSNRRKAAWRPRRYTRSLVWLALVAGFGVITSAALAATTTTTNAAPTAAASSEGLVVKPPFIAPPVPQASFTMPKKQEEGRDPFFPRSTYPYDQGTVVSTTKPTPVADLTLKGISGTQEQPLAIINNVTFGVGDFLEVPTQAGRLKIRCLEINKDAGTAAVQFGSERRDLRLVSPK